MGGNSFSGDLWERIHSVEICGKLTWVGRELWKFIPRQRTIVGGYPKSEEILAMLSSQWRFVVSSFCVREDFTKSEGVCGMLLTIRGELWEVTVVREDLWIVTFQVRGMWRLPWVKGDLWEVIPSQKRLKGCYSVSGDLWDVTLESEICGRLPQVRGGLWEITPSQSRCVGGTPSQRGICMKLPSERDLWEVILIKKKERFVGVTQSYRRFVVAELDHQLYKNTTDYNFPNVIAYNCIKVFLLFIIE